MAAHWLLPGDSEDHRLRGRAYRSEADILSLMLRILEALEGRPLRKTRLIQYANLNTKSFAKYASVLEGGGLVGISGKGYKITGRGRLTLRITETLTGLITPPGAEESFRNVISRFCRVAEGIGLSCRADEGLFDVIVEGGGRSVGIHFSNCKTSDAPRVIGAILEAHSPDDVNVVIVCLGGRKNRAAPVGDLRRTKLYTIPEASEKELEALAARIVGESQPLKP
ncbi:MAG: winged helix-turn-helix domain-containing protein [Desulfurococcales archaeon]|nr:winged helix-turn-helix domain-containing protein [Desulfurococcales archaeon]